MEKAGKREEGRERMKPEKGLEESDISTGVSQMNATWAVTVGRTRGQ